MIVIKYVFLVCSLVFKFILKTILYYFRYIHVAVHFLVILSVLQS